jgi:hypothetical protein
MGLDAELYVERDIVPDGVIGMSAPSFREALRLAAGGMCGEV